MIEESADKSLKQVYSDTNWLTKAASVTFKMIRNNKLSGVEMLDIGCGSGALMEKCKSIGFNVKGTDAASISIKTCEAKGLDIFQLDLNYPIPFKDASFDLITCIETIEHLYNPSYIISEIHRILKTNGILIISAPNEYEWFNRLKYIIGKPIDWQPWSITTHLHKSNPKQFVEFIKESKFHIIEEKYIMLSGSRFLPTEVQEILVGVSSGLFAGVTILVCKK